MSPLFLGKFCLITQRGLTPPPISDHMLNIMHNNNPLYQILQLQDQTSTDVYGGCAYRGD